MFHVQLFEPESDMFQNKISSGQKKKNWLWIFKNPVEDLKLEYLCLTARRPNKNFSNETLEPFHDKFDDPSFLRILAHRKSF